jgi:hypothetical protein
MVLGVVVLAGLVVAAVFWPRLPTPDATVADQFPLSPISFSPYLNTGPEAHYVGSEACRQCHEDRHATFRTTGMGRSMAVLNPADEPANAAFDHSISKCRYEVQRHDGQMWHRELLMAPGTEVVLAEYPMKYVIGSGRHSRSYLVEAEGFLVESPVTWYAVKKAWGMSPGYDVPEQAGFDRATGEGCLHCHAGKSEAVGATLHKMRVTEPAIGCERCHGPGSLHIERQAGRRMPDRRPAEPDLSIVNPSRLPRDLAESICQQCHLRSHGMIVARGRKFSDFRPGLAYSDFVHAYMLESTNRSMTVTGHVEQMHLSRCYQSSATLTCLTCHSPHAEPPPEARVAHYQAICQTCHKPEQCKVEPARRAKESPGNDCVHCHMPRSSTEIPHLAFTHHRIGIHREGVVENAAREDRVRPFLDLSRATEVDRKRSLGLALLEIANRHKDESRAAEYRAQAFDVLSDLHDAGLQDGALEAALARLRFDMGMPGILTHARAALDAPDLVGQDRCTALYLLADEQARSGRHAEAAAALREVTMLRRHPADWLLLAQCERAVGNGPAADIALESAVRINPHLSEVHRYLADKFAGQGDAARAAWHLRRAVK